MPIIRTLADAEGSVVVAVGWALLAHSIDSVEIASTHTLVIGKYFVGATVGFQSALLSVGIPQCTWLACAYF